MKTTRILSLALSCLAFSNYGYASPVTLQQATATFSQTIAGDFSVARAINGTVADHLGWAIAVPTGSQTAVFETAANVGFAGGSKLSFTLNQAYDDWGQHTLGRFRLSVTTDDRSTFADGLASGGDVTANWTVLTPATFSTVSGTILTRLADNSLLASGITPVTDVYTVTAQTTLTGITGVRLEALTDASLPFGGPGRRPDNGNFVLSEFSVDITPVPEPSSLALLGLAAASMLVVRRKQ